MKEKVWVKIPDVLFYQEGPGVRNTQYTNDGVKLLNVANLVDGKINLETSDRYISCEEANGKYKHFLCDEGDLIVASSGVKVDYIDKKMGFVTKEMLPLCMNTSTIRFKVLDDSQLNIRYFMYYLKSQNYKKQLSKLITGSAQLNYGPSHLEKIIFPICDFKKQEEIVLKLDLVTQILEDYKIQILKYDDLIKARFVEMFGSIYDGEYELKTLPEIVNEDKNAIKRGPFGGALKKDDFVENGYLVYEQRHAIHNDFDYAKYYITQKKYDDMIGFKVVPGDLIISCSGVTLGRIAEVPKGAKEGIINQALLKLSLNQQIMLNTFFIHQFRGEEIQEILFGFSRGSGIPNMPSMSDVKSVKFICPPLELQKEYCDFVQQVDKSKLAVQQSLEKTQQLFDSLMQEYFG